MLSKFDGTEGAVRRAHIQCPICLKHAKEGTIYCGCGKCLILSHEYEDYFSKRIVIPADSLYVVKRGRARERHGPEEWQHHHWKTLDAAPNCRIREYESTGRRWRDDPYCRVTQQKHGWFLAYCMFLDYLKKIPIICTASRRERKRYKNQPVLRWKNPTNPGKMPSHEFVFKTAVQSRTTMAYQQRRGNAYVPEQQRSRQGPIDLQLHSQLRAECQQWSLVIVIVNDTVEFTTMGRIPTMDRTTSMARTTRLAKLAVTERMSTDFLNCQSHFTNVFASQSMFFCGHFKYRHYRMSCTRRAVKTEHLTGRSTHIFFSLRAMEHSCFAFYASPNAPALAQGLMTQVSM